MLFSRICRPSRKLVSLSIPSYAWGVMLTLEPPRYDQTQLGKRMAVFEQMGAISNMFSGYLQAALYKGLNGTGGLAGWQWLFIFDGIIGIPISLWGYWAIPDLPHNTRAFYFKKEVSLRRDHRVLVRKADF